MPILLKRKFGIGSRCDLRGKNHASFQNWRIHALVFLIFAAAITVVLRLYSLQVVAYDSYKILADDQHTIFKKLVPQRGEIFLKDKDGVYPVAVNRQTEMAYAVPVEIDDPINEAERVAEILQLDKNEVLDRLAKKDDMYEPLKHKLSDDEVTKIQNAELKGIHLSEESYRFYPAGELASNVLGFVGWRNNDFGGRYGIEAFFEEKLKGEEGNISQNRDASGGLITLGKKEMELAKDGSTVVLTIDHIIQYETEKILKSAVEKFNADGGSIIVMEPETGKILAMADFPNFDPNEYSKTEDISAFRNPAVNDAYECGSVFKAITMAAGLDSEVVNPSTTYNDTGAVKEAGYTIKNSDGKVNGIQTMAQVLEKSLNTGVIYVEKLLGNKNFFDYVKRFGFGEKTEIDLLGEGSGNVNNLKNLKSNIQFFTASFGQGISVTPIQLLGAYSAIANGGVLMKPQIVEKFIQSGGLEEKIEPQEIRRVISEKAAQELSLMLRSVVVNGHGKRANVPGYAVAGKTGTAQIASTEKKGYEEGKNIGSFAGFAPLDNPRFSILVKINNPKNVEWAESSAAPAFGELMKFLLEYYNIEPTEKYSQKDMDIFNATHTLKEYFIKKEEAGKIK